MNKRQKYIKEIKELFYISVKSDIEGWHKHGSLIKSGKIDDVYFSINLTYYELNVYNGSSYVTISEYKKEILPSILNNIFYISNFKVWWYTIKIKNHINKVQSNHVQDEDFLITVKSKLKKKYIAEFRKQKLKKLN